MQSVSRHQCLIYEGSPSRSLPSIAAVARQKLKEDHRCFYLNSPTMVTGMRSYLAAAGVDVAAEIAKTRLVLSSDRDHLAKGYFDVDRMMRTLEAALGQAINDGFKGLWATGDMTWEFGSEQELSKLLEYEWRLEEFLARNPRMSGICEYHTDSLPRDCIRQSLLTHQAIYINETLSRMNPYYVVPDAYRKQMLQNEELDALVDRLCRADEMN